MRIRVINHAKWGHAKKVFAGWGGGISFLVAIGCVGGLEGTDPMPYPEASICFMILSAVLINHSIKETNK